MNEEEKKLLEETLALSKENNKILRGMRREARIGRFWQALKWVGIIVVTIWSYYLIQPYLTQLQEAYTSINEAKDAVTDIKGKVNVDTSKFQDFLDSFGN